MSELRVKISGFGGQGIILSAFILGKAASIYDQQHSSMTQAYGPEARGGACSSQVVISSKIVEYPLVDTADVLITMSQEGYDTFLPILKKGGILLYDIDLVEKLQCHKNIIAKGIPATRLAEELGKKIVANIVMLGFAAKQAKIVSPKAMQEAIADSVPSKFTELNMRAFQAGYDYNKEQE